MRILFTGGGTAGHVTPNIALMQRLDGHQLHYIGTNGMEKQLIQNCNLDVTYHQIDATKLRRKITAKNLALPFTFAKSVVQCKKILKQVEPNVVFSKGGYVGLPVVVACKLLHVPCLIHESDVSMGLANKIGALLCDKVLTAFPCHKKGVVVGSILRPNISLGDRKAGLDAMQFDGKKPVLLVLGGSLGAQQLNDLVAQSQQLCDKFDVFVISGEGKDRHGLKGASFVDNLANLYSATSVAITRCGSTTLAELTKCNVPFVGIPLTQGSRGEQVQNASYFSQRGCGVTLSNPTVTQLQNAVFATYNNRHAIACKQRQLQVDGLDKVVDLLLTYDK